MSSEAKNLEAISKAIDQHNSSCEWPAVAVAMNPYEVERLGWETIRGLPIRPDANLGTGMFRIVCAREMLWMSVRNVMNSLPNGPPKYRTRASSSEASTIAGTRSTPYR